MDALLTDLTAAPTVARTLPRSPPTRPSRTWRRPWTPTPLTPEDVTGILAFAGLGEGPPGGPDGLPERMATVLFLLDALPGRLKERLLTEFVGSVFRLRAP
ncbi:hypothetical protein AMK21_01810 [Streptomyces sp. CB00316]|nr:hypothetical protein AMK21_01810 [Streptomyces sp. CB00316]